MASHLILGLDIGTASVKAVLAEEVSGRPVIRFIHEEPSDGVRKGAIVDLPEASAAVARTMTAVRKFSKQGAKNVYVNVGTAQVRAQQSRGMVAVSRADSEIYEDDVDRALKASQTVGVSPNRMMLHTVTREFIVDGVPDIQDPVGLSGSRLEVQTIVIDAFAPHVKSVMRVVELSSGRVGGLVMNAVASARAAISRNQRELGVLMIDIGAGTTSIAAYEEQKAVGIAVLPVGSGHITNDIALGLKIDPGAAEELKRRVGHAFAAEVGAKESVDLRELVPEGGPVSRKFVAEIIEARLAEVFDLVGAELKAWGKQGGLAGGVVLVGGGAKLPGLSHLARRELKLSAQIGSAIREEWGGEPGDFVDAFEDPSFSCAMGLVLWGAEKEGWSGAGGDSWISWASPRRLFRYFAP